MYPFHFFRLLKGRDTHRSVSLPDKCMFQFFSETTVVFNDYNHAQSLPPLSYAQAAYLFPARPYYYHNINHLSCNKYTKSQNSQNVSRNKQDASGLRNCAGSICASLTLKINIAISRTATKPAAVSITAANDHVTSCPMIPRSITLTVIRLMVSVRNSAGGMPITTAYKSIVADTNQPNHLQLL